MSYPGHYRARKDKDTFQGLHFGILDLETLDEGKKNDVEGRVNVRVQIIDHEGKVAIEQVFPLKEKRFHEIKSSEWIEMQLKECVPFWGEVPSYKVLLFKATMVTFGMVFVLFPSFVLLWLLGAAIYYICIGGELMRRDRIEKRFQQRHKLNASNSTNRAGGSRGNNSTEKEKQL